MYHLRFVIDLSIEARGLSVRKCMVYGQYGMLQISHKFVSCRFVNDNDIAKLYNYLPKIPDIFHIPNIPNIPSVNKS